VSVLVASALFPCYDATDSQLFHQQENCFKRNKL